MRKILSVSIAAIFAASAAFGGTLVPVPADPIPTVPAAPMVTDWSGFYVGALAGIQNGELTAPTIPGFSRNIDATTYGGFAGYNFQQGNIVYGVEVAAQMGDATIGGLAFDFDYLVDARARLGYAAGDVLVYAAGGYSNGQITRAGTSLDMSGFNVGAGVELAVNDNFFLGGEYIYRDLSGTSFGTGFDYKTHAIQLRAGFRF